MPGIVFIDTITIQAKVVDFPQPAVPVTKIIPLIFSASAITWEGMHSSCQSGIENITTRITAAEAMPTAG